MEHLAPRIIRHERDLFRFLWSDEKGIAPWRARLRLAEVMAVEMHRVNPAPFVHHRDDHGLSALGHKKERCEQKLLRLSQIA